jgi:heptosyltransferase-1
VTTALLVKMSSLGDIVHALPALTDAALAGVTFDWVVEEAFAPIAARHPAVRTVIPVAWRRWRSRLLPSREEMQSFLKRLRMTDYDVILDSQGLIKSAAISRLARGAVRAGYDSDSAREPLAALINDRRISVPREQHAIDRQRQLFAKALGYALPGGLAFGIGTHPEGSDQLDHRLCLLLHGTTWASKHYPEAFWFDILARARADGYTVAVTWGDGTERARAERFAAKGALVWPKMSLAELTERISRVSLAIGVDSGLTHLAAAL